MPSCRESSVSAGLRANRRISGQFVTYSRGATTLSITQAVKQSRRPETIEGSGSESVVMVVVWRIAATDLGSLVLPEIGDTITASGTVHKVEASGFGDVGWEYTDTGATEFTIRTRESGFHETVVPTARDLRGNEVRVG